jgi:GNAT superfamily N-acetyltransferase
LGDFIKDGVDPTPSFSFHAIMNHMKLITILQGSDKSSVKALPEEDFAYFSHDVVEYRSYLLCEINGEVAGMVVFVENTQWMENAFGLGAVTVSPRFKNQGVGTFLVDAFFHLALLHGKQVRSTPYEPEGKLYLRSVMRRAAAKYDVNLQESS